MTFDLKKTLYKALIAFIAGSTGSFVVGGDGWHSAVSGMITAGLLAVVNVLKHRQQKPAPSV